MNIKLSICLICLLILAIPAHIFAENSQTKAALTEDDGYEEDDLLENNPQLDEILAEPVDLMPAAPLRMTLEDCIKIALEHNAKLQATGYAVDAARAQFREASAVGWPIVDYEYRSAPIPHDVSNAMDSFFSGDMAWWNKLKVGVGVPIYTFGKLSLAKEMAKSGIAASETQAFQERNSLVSKVRQLYYGVLLAEEVGRLVKEAYKRLDEEIKKREHDDDAAGTEENEDDSYSPIENLKMKVFLFDLEKRLAEARQKEAIALEGLRVQMGLSSGTVFTVYSRKLRPVKTDLNLFDDYMQVALKNRPDVKLLSTGLEVKKNQYLLEKRKFFPDLGAGAFFEIGRTATAVQGVTATDDFNDPFNFTRAGIGVQLSGRFDFHGGNARIDKARSEYYKLNLEQMIAKEAVKLDVKDAYLKAKTAQANLGRARKAEKTARQLLFLTQSNYD
ncbi:MAG: TolC family protein, partial [Deltaproteobacteria bacterium]|nr:TolC family protein [Deltaproteobacteria bacterium]